MALSSSSSSRGNPWVLIISLGLILLMYACGEARYSMWGKSATATVTNTATSDYYTKGNKWTRLRVDFVYTDAGGLERNGSDESVMNCNTTTPEIGDSVGVQYLQNGTSRLASHANPGVLALCAAFIGVGFMWYFLSGAD